MKAARLFFNIPACEAFACKPPDHFLEFPKSFAGISTAAKAKEVHTEAHKEAIDRKFHFVSDEHYVDFTRNSAFDPYPAQ